MHGGDFLSGPLARFLFLRDLVPRAASYNTALRLE
jgi:hypothetical protein